MVARAWCGKRPYRRDDRVSEDKDPDRFRSRYIRCTAPRNRFRIRSALVYSVWFLRSKTIFNTTVHVVEGMCGEVDRVVYSVLYT